MFKKILKILGITIIILIIVIGGLALFIRLRYVGTSYRSPVTPYPETTDYSSYDEALMPQAAPLLGLGKSTRQTSTGETTESNNSEQASRLVIKTGSLNMVVKDVVASAKEIIRYAEEKGGWVVSSSVSEHKELPSGSVTVRVLAENFDEAMEHFRGLAEKVEFEGSRGQDVTEEYTDLQSRLKNLEATESQLQKIMEQAGTITEVLSVQRELNTVRGQIELTKGRMQYLERSAEMATISVNLALSEDLLPIPPSEKWRPAYIIKRAWKSALNFLKGLSYLGIWVGIYGVVWVPLLIIVLVIRKILKKRKAAKQIQG